MKNLSTDQALLLFTKNPEKGKVKTRLAQTMGEEMALKIYLALLEFTRDVSLQVEADRLVWYSHYVDHEDLWHRNDFFKQLQLGEDLGARMSYAFKTTFQEGYKKVVIIGSDCATLTSEIVGTAFSKLDEVPFVIGPADDGGYYLLGMNYFEPQVFLDIEWSTETVCQNTISHLERLDQTYELLPVLSDIDYEADWKKYGWPLD